MSNPMTVEAGAGGRFEMTQGQTHFGYQFPMPVTGGGDDAAAGGRQDGPQARTGGEAASRAYAGGARHSDAAKPGGRRRSATRLETRFDYRLIYCFSFTIFLVSAIIQRIVPSRWRSFPSEGGGNPSPIAEAHKATRTIMPFAFMG